MSESPVGHIGFTLRRYFVDEFHFQHVPSLPAGSRVLDLGGNKIRKRGRFDIERYNLDVIYCNLSTAKQPDVQTDAANLPFQDQCFDAVICAELFEHLPKPDAALREVHRVLKAGGILLMTVPFLYHIHGDPDDYGRYTDHYWLRLLQQLGFEQITIERQGLFFSVLADFGKQYLSEVGAPRPFGPAARRLMVWFQQWALRYEQKPQVQSQPFIRSFTTGFGIAAVKK
jgi:SAM-dependent methyltransferase